MNRSTRVSLPTFFVVICSIVFAAQAYPAISDDASPGEPTAVRLTTPTNSPVIVIGFLGGFVSHDDISHPEVQMMQDFRREYPKGAYFRLFENNKINDAYDEILHTLRQQNEVGLSAERKQAARIMLFGHSWGGSAVVALSRKLDRAGIPVLLTIQVDSVAKPFRNDSLIPANVVQAINFYQVHGLIHGRRKISAADPSHTAILGNFRQEYQEEPAACHNFSWYSRFFTRSHVEIECDPNIWLQVRALFQQALPSQAPLQADATEFNLPATGLESHPPKQKDDARSSKTGESRIW